MIYYIAYYSEILCGILALYWLFSKGPNNLKPAIFYIIFCVGIDLLSRYAGIKMPDGLKNNHYYYNIAFVVEIILLGIVFLKDIPNLKKKS